MTSDNTPAVPAISHEELKRRLDDPTLVLVNVLPKSAWSERRIPGSINLPHSELPERAVSVLPDKDKEIVVYCASPECTLSPKAARALLDMGYRRVRDYHPGMQGWEDQEGDSEQDPPEDVVSLRPGVPVVRQNGDGAAPQGWLHAVLVRLLARTSFSRLLLAWLCLILCFGIIYWLWGLLFSAILVTGGQPVGTSAGDLAAAIYFSFVTTTSIGFGDIVPVGLGRALAVIEGATGLLIFGLVISKLVSQRQEAMLEEIHHITFEHRLGRLQTNLHMVLSELQQLSVEQDHDDYPPERLLQRLESATMILAGELRAVHDLLYRPQLTPEEPVLEAILANMSAILDELAALLARRPGRPDESPVLAGSVRTIRNLSTEICGDCVPQEYTPELTVWMDRIHTLAGKL